MADTINDVALTTDWVSAFTVTGITSTKSISIVNKGGDYVLIQIKAATPTVGNTNGVPLEPFKQAVIAAGVNGVWIRAVNNRTLVNIQEV